MEEELKRSDCTDIYEAAEKRRLRLTRLLLDGGHSANSIDSNGQNILIKSLLSQYKDTQSADVETYVRFLLERGSEADFSDKSDKTALIHVCERQLGVELVRVLVEYKADPTLQDNTGEVFFLILL